MAVAAIMLVFLIFQIVIASTANCISNINCKSTEASECKEIDGARTCQPKTSECPQCPPAEFCDDANKCQNGDFGCDSGFVCYKSADMATNCQWAIRIKHLIDNAVPNTISQQHYKTIGNGPGEVKCRIDGKAGRCCPRFKTNCWYDPSIPAVQNIEQCTDPTTDKLKICKTGNNCDDADGFCLQPKHCKSRDQSRCDTNKCTACKSGPPGVDDCTHLSPNKYCLKKEHNEKTKCMVCNENTHCVKPKVCVNGECGLKIKCQPYWFNDVAESANSAVFRGPGLIVSWAFKKPNNGHLHLTPDKTGISAMKFQYTEEAKPVTSENAGTEEWKKLKTEWKPIVEACKRHSSWFDHGWDTGKLFSSTMPKTTFFAAFLPSDPEADPKYPSYQV